MKKRKLYTIQDFHKSLSKKFKKLGLPRPKLIKLKKGEILTTIKVDL